MKRVLVVVDVQNDFVDGALGFGRIDAYERIDGVEGVEEEMRVELIAQPHQLGIFAQQLHLIAVTCHDAPDGVEAQGHGKADGENDYDEVA